MSSEPNTPSSREDIPTTGVLSDEHFDSHEEQKSYALDYPSQAREADLAADPRIL